MPKTRCTMIDKQVAHNMKQKRLKEGFSQKQIADVIDVSIQQIQKYENGVNRISSSTLFLLATFFKVPLEEFYLDVLLPDEVESIEWCTTIKKDIANNLIKIRKLFKMTHDELAHKLNISKDQVINYEKANDEIPGSIIHKLSVIFSKPITDIPNKAHG